MLSRIKNSLIFRLEQLMMRGPVARFGLVLALLLLVALVAGVLIRQLVPGFESLGDAVWWAFEHVVVPEYVDGDEGVVKRTLATGLIVLGSILFAGAVIAILVQWLDETTARLELGLTRINRVRITNHESRINTNQYESIGSDSIETAAPSEIHKPARGW